MLSPSRVAINPFTSTSLPGVIWASASDVNRQHSNAYAGIHFAFRYIDSCFLCSGALLARWAEILSPKNTLSSILAAKRSTEPEIAKDLRGANGASQLAFPQPEWIVKT